MTLHLTSKCRVELVTHTHIAAECNITVKVRVSDTDTLIVPAILLSRSRFLADPRDHRRDFYQLLCHTERLFKQRYRLIQYTSVNLTPMETRTCKRTNRISDEHLWQSERDVSLQDVRRQKQGSGDPAPLSAVKHFVSAYAL